VTIPAFEAGRALYLEFDGANQETMAFVNGKEVGRHAGGYARFRFDITAAASRARTSSP
jgi:beta-galactosidase